MSQRTLKALALAAAGALAFTIVGVPAANGAASDGVYQADQFSEVCKGRDDPDYYPPLHLWPNRAVLVPGQRIGIEPVDFENPHPDSAPVTWKSSNESVATVDANGVITALTPGDAQVSATYGDMEVISDTVRIQVRSVPEETGIELPESTLTVASGQNVLVNALLAPSLQGSRVSWALDSSSVGTLTADSDRPTATLHTPRGPASATLTASVTTPAGEVKVASAVIDLRLPSADDFVISDGVLTEYRGEATDVAIPDGVTAIGAQAFSRTNVERVWVPASVQEVRDRAFDLSSVKVITFQDDDEHPSQLKRIDSYAFSYTKVESLTLPRSVEQLERAALVDMWMLNSIHFGPKVEAGSLNPYTGWLKCVSHVEVDADNPNYETVDGVLYTKDHKHLILYPIRLDMGGSYAVLDGTEQIDDYALAYTNLTSITLPSTVRILGESSLRGNKLLTSINLPDGLASVYSDAFWGSTALGTIVVPDSVQYASGFGGTEAETIVFGAQIKGIQFMDSELRPVRRIVVRGGVDGEFEGPANLDGARSESAFFGEGMTSIRYWDAVPRFVVLPSTLTTFYLKRTENKEVRDDTRIYVAGTEGSHAWSVAKAAMATAGYDESQLHSFAPASLTLSGSGIAETGTNYAMRPPSGAPATVTATVTGGVPSGRQVRVVQIGTDGAESVLQDWTDMPDSEADTASMNVTVTPAVTDVHLRIDARDASYLVASANLTMGAVPTPAPEPTPDPAPTPDPTPDPTPAPEPTPLSGQWVSDSIGWWYRYADGSYPAGVSVRIGDSVYRFDARGYMRTGWVSEDGAWFYHHASGAQASGWVKDGGSWYYLDPASGRMATGWLLDGSTWYYLTSSGAMVTGWVKDGSTWYYLSSSGAMATGWLLDGSTWYYLMPSGAMATGWVKDGSTWYYLRSSGAMATGWLMDGGSWYYLSTNSGAMYTGGHWIGWTWYNFADSGRLMS